MKRDNKGFTLIELIAVQVIICLLLIVTVPQARLLLEKSRMQRLDEKAQTLFLLTQNRLSKLSVRGELSKLAGLSLCGTGTEGEFYLAFGYGGLLPASQGKAETFEPALRLLGLEELSDGAMEKGCFVLEYRPAEGIITAVYCSDREFNYNSVSSDSLCAKRHSRDWEDWRRQNRIGFYCLNEAYYAVKPSGRVQMSMKTVNGEELLLYIKGTAFLDDKSEFSDYDPDKWRLAFEVSCADSGLAVKLDDSSTVYIKQKTACSFSIDYTLYLDSPFKGRSFTGLYPGLRPGEDITVKAQLYYTGEEASLAYGSSQSCKVNSMFFGKDGEYYIISNNRHLKNMEVLPEGSFKQLGDLE